MTRKEFSHPCIKSDDCTLPPRPLPFLSTPHVPTDSTSTSTSTTDAIMDPNRPQNDFEAMTQGLQAAATEAGRMANLPAIQGGHDILHAVHNLNNINNRLTGIEQRIDGLGTRIDANSNNTLAFVTNSHLHHVDTLLTPLHHRVINMAIEDFPTNSGEI
ncbi:hypothetical protein DDE82_001883 [Stemphylium lycopersici]|nr:hypothetical protein DDE82_001883 [Stemphylium lycopersici]